MPNRLTIRTQRRPYRYPGVQPFTTGQANVFFGREKDVAECWRLIRRESLVVLYGKSGLGKSSLINAGIIPTCRLEGIYNPIVIRFGAWTNAHIAADTPLETTKALLTEGFSAPTFLQRLLPGDASLWQHAKTRQLLGGGRPLLLFDQFEELFTYPEAELRAFKEELAELLHTGIPLRFRRLAEAASSDQLSDEDEDRLEIPLETRIVFVIRSDRMHLLDRLTDFLPTILRHLYELQALRLQDAEKAIVAPAAAPGDFRTPVFTWTPAALSQLLAYLQDADNEHRVEGILLQLLCQYFEDKKVDREAKTRLDTGDLGDLEQIVGNYYAEKIDSLGASDIQLSARRLIEEGLVMEGENIRLSLHEAQIARQYGVDANLLERLVNSRLLRPEPFMRGGYSYELAHDRLVAPVLRAKAARREEEARVAEELKQRETEQRLHEAEATAQLEIRKRRRANVLAVLAIIGLLVAAWQYRRADSAKEQAEANEREAKTMHDQSEQARLKAEAALRKIIAAKKEKMQSQIRLDLDAGFTESVARNRTKLITVDSLEQRNAPADEILNLLEK